MAGHILAPALPFTRLRPEAEVVAEVMLELAPKLDLVLDDIGGGRVDSTTRDIFAARALLGEILSEVKK